LFKAPWGGGGGGVATTNGSLRGERSGFVYVQIQLCETFIGVCPKGNQWRHLSVVLCGDEKLLCGEGEGGFCLKREVPPPSNKVDGNLLPIKRQKLGK
jgi:hypothetical protein